MDKHVRWEPAMSRIILDCVDEAAGDDTIFLKDRTAATDKVMTRLRPPVTDAHNYAALTQKKIFTKLGGLATSGGVQKGGFRAFLQIGTTCLDLSKLPPDTYSQAEIRASSQHRQSNDKREPPISNTSNASKKGASEIENKSSKVKKLDAQHRKDEDSNKRPKRPHSSAFSQDPKHAQVPTKRKRTTINPPTYNDEISDSQSSANGDDDDYAEDYEYATGKIGRALQRPFTQDPSITSQAQAQTQVQVQAFYVCEVCEGRFHTKKDLLAHKPLHEKSPPRRNTSQSSFQASTTDKIPILTPGELKLLELATLRRGGEHTDVAVIEAAMENIQVDTFDATILYLTNSKIDGNEMIELRVDSYQDSLNDLLRGVFGSGLIDRLAQFRNVRCPSIKRCDIILATIGYAVTSWALIPLPQGEVRDGVLGEMNKILQARSPVFQDRVMEMAIHQYLEKHVKPLAQGFAQVFAHDLFHLLGHFLPGELKEDNSQRPSDIHNTRTDTSSGQNTISPDNVPPEISVATTSHSSSVQDEQQTLSTATAHESRTNLTSSEPTSGQPTLSEPTSSKLAYSSSDHARRLTGWPPKAQRDPIRVFLKSLEDVFASALRLRLDMEMKGNARYNFLFPLRGDSLDLEKFVVHNKANNRRIPIRDLEDLELADQQASIKVHVGLTPIVRGTFRKGDRDGEWRETPILISKGCVHIRSV